MKELDELMTAIKANDLDKVKKLLPTQGVMSWAIGRKKEPPSFLNMRDIKGNTALIYAIRQGDDWLYSDFDKKIIDSKNNPQIIKWLIDSGADINLTDSTGCSPFVAMLKRDSIFAKDIYFREDFKISDADRISLLESRALPSESFSSLSTKDKIADFIKSFHDPNAVDYKGNNLFHVYCENYTFYKLFPIEFLIQRNIDINHVNKDRETPFILAIKHNNIELARQIKQTPGFVFSREDQNLFNKELHKVNIGVYGDKLSNLKNYLSLGADINSLQVESPEDEDRYRYKGDGLTILHHIIRDKNFYESSDNSKFFDQIKFFIENGANPNTLGSNGKTIFTEILERDDLKKLNFVKESIEKITNDKIKFLPEDKKLIDKALYEKITGWNFDNCKTLLECGADLNSINNDDGKTPLIKFIEAYKPSYEKEQEYEKIKYLISKGADFTIADRSGKTPFRYLLENEQYHYKISQLKEAIEKATGNKFQFLPIEQEILNQQIHKLVDSLSSSNIQENDEKFRRLLEIGADPNCLDANGQTLLEKLIDRAESFKEKLHNTKILKYIHALTDFNVDVNKKNTKNISPFTLILEKNFADEDKVTLLSKLTATGKLTLSSEDKNSLNRRLDSLLSEVKDDGTSDIKSLDALSIINKYLDLGFDGNIRDKHGKTFFLKLVEKIKSVDNMNHHKFGVFDRLIKNGADINTSDNDGNSPFSIACSRGAFNLVDKLREAHKTGAVAELVISKQDQANLNKLLHDRIAENKDSDRINNHIVKLIQNGADVNSLDKDGRTILQIALNNENYGLANKIKAIKDHKLSPEDEASLTKLLSTKIGKDYDIIKLEELINLQTNINSQDENGETALYKLYKNANFYDETEINKVFKKTEALLKKGADINLCNNNGDNVFSVLIGNNQIESILKLKNLLNQVPERDFKLTPKNQEALDAKLKEKIDYFRLEDQAIENLLKIGANPNIISGNGETILTRAIKYSGDKYNRYTPPFEMLYKFGADLNQENKAGDSPFKLALTTQAENIREKLLEQFNNNNKFQLSSKDKKFLSEELVNAVDQLIEKYTTKDYRKIDSSLENIKFYIQYGADVNSLDKDKKPVFIKIIEHIDPLRTGYNQAFDMLAKNGVDLNLADKDGNTPFKIAFFRDQFEVTDKIFNAREQGAVKFIFSDSDKAKIIDRLIDKTSSLEETDPFPKAIEKFLSYAGDINSIGTNGNTLLITALLIRNPNILKELIKRGADINIKDSQGRYPLDIALEQQNRDLVRELYAQPDVKGDIEKAEDLLGISMAGQLRETEKNRYPYFKKLDNELGVEVFNTERLLSIYKEMKLKSLYFRTKKLELNEELAKLIKETTQVGLKEMIIFCNKEESLLTKENFNEFLQTNNVRINLKIVPITSKDLDEIAKDEFGKRDILAIKNVDNYKFIYRNGHSIELLNNKKSDEIITDNYNQYKLEIASRHYDGEYKPKYILHEKEKDFEPLENGSFSLEIAVDRERETSLDFNQQMDTEKNQQLAIDQNQAGSKFDRNQAKTKIMEIYRKSFLESYILDPNYSEDEFTLETTVDRIFDSSDKIQYITEQALGTVVDNRFLLKNGINTNNMPIGFALTDGIIFASSKRPDLMPINEFTIKLDPLISTIEHPLQYSWLEYSALDSITANDLYGTNIAPFLRGRNQYPAPDSRNQKLCFPYYTRAVGYEVNEIRQEPVYLSKVHPDLIQAEKSFKQIPYLGLNYANLVESDKKRLDHIYKELDKRGISQKVFNDIINSHQALNSGDFLLSDKAALFLDKLFYEILPLNDPNKIQFFQKILKDSRFQNSYLEDVFSGVDGLYKKTIEFLVKQEIPIEHHELVKRKIIEIARGQDKTAFASKMDRAVEILSATAANGGNLYEQLDYLAGSSLDLGASASVNLIKSNNLNVVYRSNIEIVDRNSMFQKTDISGWWSRDQQSKWFSSYLSTIPPHQRPAIDVVNGYLEYGYNLEYELGRLIGYHSDKMIQDAENEVRKERGYKDDYAVEKRINQKIKEYYKEHENEKHYNYVRGIKTNDADLLKSYTTEQIKVNNLLLTLNILSSSGNNYDATYPDGEFSKYVSLFNTMFEEVKLNREIPYKTILKCNGVKKDLNKDIYIIEEDVVNAWKSNSVVELEQKHEQMVGKLIELYKEQPNLNFHQIVALGLVKNFVLDNQNVMQNAKLLYQYKEYFTQSLRTTLATKITEHTDISELKARANNLARLVNFLASSEQNKPIHQLLTNNGKNPENIALFACFFAQEKELSLEKVTEFVADVGEISSDLKMNLLKKFALSELPFAGGKIGDSNFPTLKLADIKNHDLLGAISRDKESLVNYEHTKRFNDVSLDSKEQAKIDFSILQEKYRDKVQLPKLSYRELKLSILRDANYIKQHIAKNNPDQKFLQELSKDIVHQMLKTTAEQYLGWENIVTLTTDLLFNPEKTLNAQLLDIEANNRHIQSLFKNVKETDKRQEFLSSLLAEPKIAKNELGKILKFLRTVDYQALAEKNYDLNRLVKDAGNDILSNNLESFKIAIQLFMKPETKLEFVELTNIMKRLVEKDYSPAQIKKIFAYCTTNEDYRVINIFSSISGRTNNIDKIINQIIELKPEEVSLIEQKIGLSNLVKLAPMSKIQDTIATVLKYKDDLALKEYRELYKSIKGSKKLDYSKNLFGYLLSPDSDYFPKEEKSKLVFKHLNDLEPLREIFAERNLKRFDYDEKRLKEIVSKIKNLNKPSDLSLPAEQQEVIFKALERIYIEAKKYSHLDIAQLQEESRKLQNNRPFIIDNPPEDGEVLENDLKFIALSSEMAYRKIGVFPRDAQLLSIAMTALLEGDVNQQISTGQGKTLITALQSAYLAYTGQTTLVTSSNRQLAARDLRIVKGFFDGLGLDVVGNIITINTDPSELSAGKVVYSTGSDIALYLAQKKFDKAPGYLELLARLSRVGDEIDDALTSPITYKLAVPMSDITQNQARNLFKVILDYTESNIFKDHQLSVDSHIHNLKEMIQVKFSQFDNSYRYPLSIVQVAGLSKREEPEAKNILDLNKALVEIEKEDLDRVLKKLLLSAQTAKSLKKNIDYMVPNENKPDLLINAVPIVGDRVAVGTRFGDGIQTFLHLLIERDNPALKGKMDCSLPNSVMFDLNAKNLHNYINVAGGRNIGLSGTLGGPSQLKEFQSVLGINSIAIPDYEDSKKIVTQVEVTNTKEQDQKLLNEIDQINKQEPNKPIIVFCENAIEVARVHELLKGKREHIQFADANIDNHGLDKIVDNAGKDGYLTITTPILGRGNDFITKYPGGYSGFNLCTELTYNTLMQIIGRIGRNGYPGIIKSFFNKEKYPNFKNHEDFMEHIAQVDTAKRALMRPPADIMLHFNAVNAGRQLDAIKTRDYIASKWKEITKSNNKLPQKDRQPVDKLQKELLSVVIKKYPEERVQLLEFLTKLDEHLLNPEGGKARKFIFNAEAVEQVLETSQISIDASKFPTDWKSIDQLARSISLKQVAIPKEQDPLAYKLFYDVFYEAQATVLYTHFFEIDKKHEKFKILSDHDDVALFKDDKNNLVREFEIEGIGSGGDLMIDELKHSFELYHAKKPNGIRLNNIAKIIQNMDNIDNIDINKLSPGKYQAFAISTKVTTEAGHAESILTDGRYLFWVNRGAGVENPGIRIFKISKDFATVKDILNSLKIPENQSKTVEKIYSLLEKKDNAKIPEFTQVDMPDQTIGNCGWAQVESLVKAIGIAGSLDSNSKEPPKEDSPTLQKAIREADDVYQDFLKFDRLQRMEEVLYTRDKDFTPKYLSKDVIAEINLRRPYLTNPISLELIKPLTEAFEQNIEMFENSIYEKDAQSLLQKASVETILSEEFGNLFTKNLAQAKELLLHLSTTEINGLRDLYNKNIKLVCGDLDMQARILTELAKYINTHSDDGEEVIKELENILNPVKILGNKNKALDQAILDAVRYDNLASATILINAIDIKNIATENIKTIAEYALNNHNDEILSLIRPKVEEIIFQQNAVSPSDIAANAKDGVLKQLDEKFKFPTASAAKGPDVLETTMSEMKKADIVSTKPEAPKGAKKTLHWQSLSNSDKDTLKSLEVKYQVKLDTSSAINKLALKLHPDKVSNRETTDDFIKLGELKDKLKKGVFVEKFSEEDLNELRKAQEQTEQYNYLNKWQEGISKTNFAINVANAGINAYRFIAKPTYEHGKQTLTDAAYLASMTYGFSWFPMTLTATDVLNKVYNKEYTSALKTAATSLAYQAMPVIAAQIAGPKGALAYSALMTGYSGINLLSNISKLYQESTVKPETDHSSNTDLGAKLADIKAIAKDVNPPTSPSLDRKFSSLLSKKPNGPSSYVDRYDIEKMGKPKRVR